MENNNNNFFPCSEDGEGVLAMVRITVQPWCSVYDGSTAFSRGTLFPALDLPFIGREAAK